MAMGTGYAAILRTRLASGAQSNRVRDGAMPNDDRTHAFIVRIWYEPCESEADVPECRGVVEHVATHRRQYFRTFDRLVDFIEGHTGAPEDPPGGKPSRRRVRFGRLGNGLRRLLHRWAAKSPGRVAPSRFGPELIA